MNSKQRGVHNLQLCCTRVTPEIVSASTTCRTHRSLLHPQKEHWKFNSHFSSGRPCFLFVCSQVDSLNWASTWHWVKTWISRHYTIGFHKNTDPVIESGKKFGFPWVRFRSLLWREKISSSSVNGENRRYESFVILYGSTRSTRLELNWRSIK